MGDVFWAVVVLLFLFGGSAAGLVQHLQSQRHKFKLEMARERANLELAKAKLLEEQNRQSALEVRKAELEIERYDRRIPGLPLVPPLDADAGTDTGDATPPLP